jgi:hypothetical protein
MGRIVRDEAMHGTFGFAFLDWAGPELKTEERAYVGARAERVIVALRRSWAQLRTRRPRPVRPADPLAWMETEAYLRAAETALRRRVVAPLVARAIPVRAEPSSDASDPRQEDAPSPEALRLASGDRFGRR